MVAHAPADRRSARPSTRLLPDGAMRLSTTLLDVMAVDLSHFTRCFRRAFGVLPSALQRPFYFGPLKRFISLRSRTINDLPVASGCHIRERPLQERCMATLLTAKIVENISATGRFT